MRLINGKYNVIQNGKIDMLCTYLNFLGNGDISITGFKVPIGMIMGQDDLDCIG
jgi:hypothetical protein